MDIFINTQPVSDDELLAAVEASPDFVKVTDSAHLAYLLDVDEDEKEPAEENLTLTVEEARALPKADTYEVGQRIILAALPYIGATVRSFGSAVVGIDYDNDAEGDNHWAVVADVRPMPYL